MSRATLQVCFEREEEKRNARIAACHARSLSRWARDLIVTAAELSAHTEKGRSAEDIGGKMDAGAHTRFDAKLIELIQILLDTISPGLSSKVSIAIQ